MIDVIFGVTFFTGIVLMLSMIILLARSRLVPVGNVEIIVNDDRRLRVPVGGKLINALAGVGLHMPGGCGGKGTCGQCRLQVLDGGGPLLPTEVGLISRREADAHVRLACQVSVRGDLRIRIPDEVFGVRQWECVVRSNRNVATYIKELVLVLPQDEQIPFRAGGYIQVMCPPYRTSFADFDIDLPYREEWDRRKLWRFEAGTGEPTTRAYSMANYPGEKGVIILNIRIATPPPGAGGRVPPGVVSSYLFGLNPGDSLTITGPYGEFFAQETGREMVFIGGGTGMAPLRSIILDQLKRLHTRRKISFWYGARSKREIFYQNDFDELAASRDNFDWTVALSEPESGDHWSGPSGFIHQVVHDRYLKDHPAPEDCEYYICGPSLMMTAVLEMLDGLGVERENIMFDDFGA
ncbi:MAG: NADH:ubiquinone reductase (Na(+)-transporting) subunit F [Myxococcales bacterium]|nr:NADH:ubiquinone reductase (Na(+)-transporting) subunit F [Myxococcales bacterium]MDH3844187.1 NADH:ubiquinone reductase (Na(+)-transporting) subunit F [Myxococcales bacterium]